MESQLAEDSMPYIDELIENCKRAKAAKPVHNFVFQNIAQLDGIEKGIYIIKEVDGDNKRTFVELSNYKKAKQRACPKLNAPSPVMYVGSFTTGIKKRIEQHIGNGPKNTYALHLSHWFNGKYEITIKVYDEPVEVIQIIEDSLSYDLSPAFGKRGGNNK